MSQVLSLQEMSNEVEDPDLKGSWFACSEASWFLCA